MPPASEQFHLGSTATAEQIFQLIGMDDLSLRDLARRRRPDGSPWIPKPVNGRYQTVPTLRGWRDYMERGEGKWRVFSTMDAAAAGMGCSKALLRAMKKGGVQGFDNAGRVYPQKILAGLETWLAGRAFDHPELHAAGVSSWHEYRDKFSALNEFEKYKSASARTIDRENAAETARLVCTILNVSLDKLKAAVPKLAGRSASEMKSFADKFDRHARRSTRIAIEELEQQIEAELSLARQQASLPY